MPILHFVEYDPNLRERDKNAWKRQRLLQISHASSVSHSRRRKRQAHRNIGDGDSPTSIILQPQASALDPLLSLAVDISDADKTLLHEYLTRVPGEIYGTSPEAYHCPVRETTLEYIQSSEALLQWTIFLSQLRKYSLQHRAPNSASIMQRRQQIYGAMRKQTASHAQSWSDATLYGIGFAAMAEHRLGNLDVAQIHLAGCISMWAARRANGGEPLPFPVATVILYDLVVFGLPSVLNFVQDSAVARKHALVTLRTMQRWHFLRRERSLRLLKADGNGHRSKAAEEFDFMPGPQSALFRSLEVSLADETVEGMRIAFAIIWSLSVGLWWRRHDDSTVSALLQKLDHRLSSALITKSDGTRSTAVSPSGLVYTTVAVIYSEMGSTMDYERVIIWHTAQFLELLMRLPRQQWDKLRDALASWIFGALSINYELRHFDTKDLEVEFR